MNKKILTTLWLLLLVFLSSCSPKDPNDNNLKEEVVSELNSIKTSDRKVGYIKDLSEWSSSKIKNHKIQNELLWSVVNQMEENYQENSAELQEVSKNLIKKINEANNTSADAYYFKWFYKEVSKDYTWAIEEYTKWLQSATTNTEKSLLLNQIAHSYDLSWDTGKASEYYAKAISENADNVNAQFNIIRNHLISWEVEKAETISATTQTGTLSKRENIDLVVLKAHILHDKGQYNQSNSMLVKSIFDFWERVETHTMTLKNNYMILSEIIYKQEADISEEQAKLVSTILKNSDTSLTKSVELNSNKSTSIFYYSLIQLLTWDTQMWMKNLDVALKLVDSDITLM